MKKIMINITDAGVEELNKLKQIMGCSTISSTMQKSLKLANYLVNKRREGYAIILERKNNRLEIDF